ncbi:hypothetical protein VTN31DRAFT_5275 [Thermomyces dupontii]|uniref:uncharacterized protein n=1 Tax=Talaromyces thermophilus TaxID=28565 RepID=UPI003743428C
MVSQVAQNQATLMQQFAADQREREAGIQMQIAALQRQLGGASGNAPPSATEQRPRSEPASSWPATVAAELGPNPAPGDPRHAQGGVQQQGRGTPGRPAYTMSREVKPVPDLWREWTEGLHGNPPVQVLESQHGSEWRREHNERMFSVWVSALTTDGPGRVRSLADDDLRVNMSLILLRWVNSGIIRPESGRISLAVCSRSR